MGGGPSKAERRRRDRARERARQRARQRQNVIDSKVAQVANINGISADYISRSRTVNAEFVYLNKIINPDPLPTVSTSGTNATLQRSRNQSSSNTGSGSGSGSGSGGHKMSNEAIMREFVKVRDELYYLLKEIPKQEAILNDFIDTKDILEADKVRFKYLIISLTAAISDMELYGDLGTSSRNFFRIESEQLNSKINKREKLNYDNYERRNEVMDRATQKLGSKYSNDYSNVKYQDQHTQFFVSLNAIFWYLYYLLILVIGYQLRYIQNNMTTQNKIIWITVLVIYPFLYYAYDLFKG
jgi:SMC interacting uncharacterized protein involved in chromosome segregation